MTLRARRALGMAALMVGSSCSASSVSTTATNLKPITTEVAAASVPTPTEPVATAPAHARCLPADTEGEVVLWHSLGGDVAGDVMIQLQDEFNRTHTAHLTTKHVGGDPEMVDALARTPVEDWPDIVVTSENITRTLVDTKRFLAPASCDAQVGNDMFPVVRQTYTVDGELQALPWGVSLPVLVFDAAKFRKAGLDVAAPPLTLTELLQDSEALSRSGVSPQGLVLSDWCANVVLEQYAAKRGEPVAPPDDGHATREFAVDLETPDNIADLRALRDGVEAGHVQWMGGNPSGFDDLLNIAVPDGGAVMAIHTAAALGDVISLLDGGNFPGVELGVGPLPGPGPGSLIGGNALWLADPDDATVAGRAWEAIDWLYQPEQLATLAAATGYVPPTESASRQPVLLESWAKHPQLRVAYDQMLATPVTTASSGLVLGPSIDFDFILFDACTKIITGGADIDTTLRQTSSLVNDIVSDYDAEQTIGVVVPDEPITSGLPGDSAVEIRGSVACASGSQVVGVWIEAEAGGSGFAKHSKGAGGSSDFAFTLSSGGRYRVEVGCGGTEQRWATNNKSPFVSGSQLSFVCDDSTSPDPTSEACQQL